jgi:hypothetical protein
MFWYSELYCFLLKIEKSLVKWEWLWINFSLNLTVLYIELISWVVYFDLIEVSKKGLLNLKYKPWNGMQFNNWFSMWVVILLQMLVKLLISWSAHCKESLFFIKNQLCPDTDSIIPKFSINMQFKGSFYPQSISTDKKESNMQLFEFGIIS